MKKKGKPKNRIVMRKAESETRDKKDSLKRTIGLLVFALCGIVFLIACIVSVMVRDYKLSQYPKDFFGAQDEVLSLYSEQDTYTLRALPETAILLGEQGISIYPYETAQQYDFSDDMYAKVITDLGGKLYIAKGSGDIKTDIESYTDSYFDFIGKIEPVYTAKFSGSGRTSAGAYASWTSGNLDSGNVFYREDIYLAAVSVYLQKGSYVTLIYASTNVDGFRESGVLLESFANFAVIESAHEKETDKDDADGALQQQEEENLFAPDYSVSPVEEEKEEQIFIQIEKVPANMATESETESDSVSENGSEE